MTINPAVRDEAERMHDGLYLLSREEREGYFAGCAARLGVPLCVERRPAGPVTEPEDPIADGLRTQIRAEEFTIRDAQQIVREQERAIAAARVRLQRYRDRLTARLDQRARESAKELA